MTMHEKQALGFQFCGYTGFLLGFVQAVLLVRYLHLSQLTLLGITGTVILTFYVLMMITKILAGGEVIIYYHHEIAVIATTAVFLWLTRQPVLRYLDVTVLGLGVFLACGRIGCFMVGCCHGRPCKWGVKYTDEHAEAGFPGYLVGVRLFPIQAVESALALSIVICGMVLVLKGYAPGTALVFYVIAYGWGRFCLEFFRGDSARSYLWGFSEAQWTSLLLAILVSCAERAKVLPASRWYWATTVMMVVCMSLVGMWRRFDASRRFELLHPRHVREIIEALHHLRLASQKCEDVTAAADSVVIHVVRTSLGYRISSGRHATESRTVEHFSLSKDGSLLQLRGAQLLCDLLLRLNDNADSFELIHSGTGVFHVLFASAASPSASHNLQRQLPVLASRPSL